MINRMRIPALLAAGALALAGCGGDSKKDDESTSSAPTTTATAQTTTPSTRDPQDKAAMELAIGSYNRGYDRFLAALKRDSKTGNLQVVQADVAAYRTVLYSFDKAIRDIRFDDALVPEVNAILESNRHLISRLDYVGQARTFHAAQRIYNRFLKARAPTVKAINNLHDKL
jgi:hypothetical protein